MTEKIETVTLEWCGPTGHISKTHGELHPGRTYAMDPELATALVDTEFWRQPGKKAAPKAEE